MNRIGMLNVYASRYTLSTMIAVATVQHTSLREYASLLERAATKVELVWGLLLLARLWVGVPEDRALPNAP